MKKFILLMVTALMVISVPSYAQNKKEKELSPKAKIRAERKAKEQADILQCISLGKIKIVISRIYPTESVSFQNASGNISKNTSDGYYVQLINNNIFTCYLPYMGTSKTPIMGGQNLSLEAKDQKVEIIKEYDTKTESYLYQFNYKNENIGDTWKCTIQLFTNGEANIRMDGNSRDSISYTGKLIIMEDDKTIKK
ncbi:MAG: DUF4251 domain-containing protein [Bacteroidales bacterium]